MGDIERGPKLLRVRSQLDECRSSEYLIRDAGVEREVWREGRAEKD